MEEKNKKNSTTKKTTTKKAAPKTAAKKTEKKPVEKKQTEKKTTVKKSVAKKAKPKFDKKKFPKIEKPVASKKVKEMTSKEKRDFEREMNEYKDKVRAQKAEIKAEKQRIREKKSAEFKKTSFGKFVGKILPEQKKAPKLEDPKLAKDDIRRRQQQKKLDKRTQTIRRRAIGVVVMCVAVSAVILGGFKMAGALEPNAGLAAKTGDKYFTEADVTKYITEQTFYKQYSRSQSTWQQYLSMYGMTSESFRQNAIENHFAHDELVRLAAEDQEITVDENEVDKDVAIFKSKYAKEADYKKALETAGYTEETYREHVYQALLEKNLIAKVVTTDAPSDDDVKEYLSSYSSAYKDARQSSHILFDAKDQAKAQEVLDKINSGALSFEAAVAQYSTDESTKAKSGDRGWDKIESFTSAYNTGLSGLSVGEVNNTLVTDKDGIHIVKCTNKWETPEKVESLDGVPQAIIEDCRKKKDESNQRTKLDEWLKTWASDHGVETTIYPMPTNVPYYVDPSTANQSIGSTAGGAGGTTIPMG